MKRSIGPLLLGTAIGALAPVMASASLYDPPSTFKLDGENPHSAVVADFNEDGTDDLAAVFPVVDKLTGATVGSRLNFLGGNGAGTLKIETTVDLPFDVRSMATGDFDGDGQPDLAVAQRKPDGTADAECGSAEGVVVYLGDHDELEPRVEYAGCITSVPSSELTALDADRDGLDDLIVGDFLLLGNGDGTFRAGAALPSGDKNVVDIDGDGVLDVMTDDDAVCGLGDGTFVPCPPIPNDALVPTDPAGRIVTVNYALYGGGSTVANDAAMARSAQPSADLDGDGFADLVGWAATGLETPIITYWRSCGWHLTTVRSFRKRAGAGRGSGYYVSRRMNLYTCNTSDWPRAGWEQVSYSSNKVVPARSALRASLVRADGSVEQVLGTEIAGIVRAVHLTDVDEDGIVDVLASIGIANSEGHVVDHPEHPAWVLFAGLGSGRFADPVDTDLDLAHAMPGDWNGDGLTDFARYVTPIDSEHELSVSFHAPPTTSPAPSSPPVDTTAPVVAIVSPAEGAATTGIVTISATASDEGGVAEVVFEYDGTTIGWVGVAPYQVAWDTSALLPGAYTLLARATDLAGNSAAATITVSVGTASTSPPPEPAPEPPPSSAQPTGETIEFSGTVTAVGVGYFVVDGLRVSIGAGSIVKFNDGAGPEIELGAPAEGKAEEYDDGTALAIKAEFG